jgi:hypothetical protein
VTPKRGKKAAPPKSKKTGPPTIDQAIQNFA